MRIDKYLWCIRFYKTRSLAKEACKKGHVKIDNASIKASKLIFNDEIITIRKDQINYKIQVLDIPTNRVGAKLVDLYRKDCTLPEEFEKLRKQFLDTFKDKPDEARKGILDLLMQIRQINQVRPGAASIRVFFDAKSDEIFSILDEAGVSERQQAFAYLSLLDPIRTETYRKLIR